MATLWSETNPYLGEPKGDTDFARITDNVARVAEAPKPPIGWYIAFGIALAMLTGFGASLGWVMWVGIGAWGNMHPVAWAFPIVNFVFWVGIGHAGTLISAILFLLRQTWRTAINRFAEAMTIFAVICAGIFPGVHIGRPWMPYYMFPVPNQMSMWPQFRSPLEWDIFAVGTYFTISLLFWFMGMIPDLATIRDRATTTPRRFIYGILAMGWRGSSRQWHRYERAYLLLAALATPLVLSVHSVVSFDFATSQAPGWHTTIFPPYFVAGAIFGGFAMVVTLAVPARQFFGLKRLIEIRHLELMNKVILATGMMVGYAYGMEFFIAWYSGNPYENFVFANRLFGPYAWAYWTMIACNVVIPQLHWFEKVRTNVWATLAIGVVVNVGMWFERFVIICTSMSRDFMPANWGYYIPSKIDFLTLGGSFGLFFTLFLLFCRFLPMVAIAEVKSVHRDAHAGHGHDAHEHSHSPRTA
ncbi:MAG: NrfD/PsrC family molybdoenzyme membrane anchor subunit [Polyangiaceae bacterium]|nr:NrfD/PsrC family molybdoenzyme membrane anchor subunit [Polyangiaceae bacterium]